MDQHPPCGHSVSAAQYELTTSWQPPDNDISAVLPEELRKGPARGPRAASERGPGAREQHSGASMWSRKSGGGRDEIKTERRVVVECQLGECEGCLLCCVLLLCPPYLIDATLGSTNSF